MTITAASVDATGCFLSVTGTWARSTGFQSDGSATVGSPAAAPFTDYALQANSGAPRLKLNVSRPGFVRSSGQAVAASRAKVILGMHPKRTAVMYDPPSGRFTGPGYDALFVPNNIALEEVDNGTTRTVKIVLSQPIYASDTAVTMDVLTGWRAGESAATGITVDTSAVTAVHPLVVARPATAALQIVNGPFWFDPVIAAHWPENRQAVCAVKYTLTDGTNTTTPIWVTAVSTSPLYGDGLRTWGATLDPTGLYPGGSGATAGGVINVNYTVYPWTGAPRNFSTATPTIALGYSTICERGVPMLYDPAGTRYPAAFIVIDPINGGGGYNASAVKSTLVAAQQVPAATKPKDLSTAIACIKVAARTTGTNTFSYDGATVVIPDSTAIPFDNTGPIGTTPNGAVSIGVSVAGSGASNNEAYLNIVGDPTLTAAQARARCQLNCGTAASPNFRGSRYHWQNLTVNANNFEIVSAIHWVDNVSITGTLNPTGSNQPFKALGAYTTPGTGTLILTATNVSYFGHGVGLWKNAGALLVRNHQGDKGIPAGPAVINITTPTGSSNTGNLLITTSGSDADGMSDNIRYNVDLRGNSGGGPYATPYYNDGAGTLTQKRLMSINVLYESTNGNYTLITSSDTPSITANGCSTILTLDCLWEGVTAVGDRSIFLYDEPAIAAANITASITGNVMTVTAVSSMNGTSGYGTIKVGSTITGTGVTAGTTVASLGTGTGGNGTYNLTTTPDVASRAMTAVALNDIATLTNVSTGIILRNVYHDKIFTKTDVYSAPTVLTARRAVDGTSTTVGYAKARTGSHSFLFGVSQFNVIDGWRFFGGANNGGCQEDRGLNFKINPSNNSDSNGSTLTLGYPKFTDDRSHFGTNAGFGDYKPAAGSPLIGMATDANTDLDLRGVTRAALFSTGAIEGDPIIATAFAFRRSGFVGGGLRVGL